MAIREIFTLIEQYQGEIPKDKLRETLRKKGYPEDEIEAAFLMSENAAPAAKSMAGQERKKITTKPQRPTLWGAVVRGQELDGEKSQWRAVDEGEQVDVAKRVKLRKRWELIAGLLIPGAFYLFGLTIFVFVELFFIVSDITQVASLGISVIASFLLYLWLRNLEAGFGRGLIYGVLILFTALVYTLAFKYSGI